MGGSTLIAISKNEKGWYYKKEKEVGYYRSLADVMVDAYREEYESNHHGTPERGDQSGTDRGSA